MRRSWTAFTAVFALVWTVGTCVPTAAQTTQLATPPVCAGSLCTAPTSSSQLPNLSQLKDEIKTYYTDGSYDAEVTAVETDAQHYLDLRAHAVRRPALVLDIDDTSLLTYGYEVDHDFGYDPTSWHDYALKGFPAIAATLALAKHAAAENIAVIFVTGRRESERDLTRSNLVADGFPIDGLYLRPADDHAPSVVPYKSSARAEIESQGYTILETIGDQWSDLLGGHAERAYKLPNPMYFIK